MENSLTGLEWAIGIPGTIGGAIRGNAGAFGSSMANVVEEVKIFDSHDFKIKKYKNKDCLFDYRKSVFKENKNLIIVSVKLRLQKGNKVKINKKMKKYLNYRKKHQPLSAFSAGSIFKNYQGVIRSKKLLNQFPKLLEFNSKKVIPAGFLIDKCGLKGKRIGQAEISTKQANFIINLGNAKSRDVISLMNLIQNKVKNKFGIMLEKEIFILSGANKLKTNHN